MQAKNLHIKHAQVEAIHLAALDSAAGWATACQVLASTDDGAEQLPALVVFLQLPPILLFTLQ